LEKGKVEPAHFDRKILVPFTVEPPLSGVQKTVNEKQELSNQAIISGIKINIAFI